MQFGIDIIQLQFKFISQWLMFHLSQLFSLPGLEYCSEYNRYSRRGQNQEEGFMCSWGAKGGWIRVAISRKIENNETITQERCNAIFVIVFLSLANAVQTIYREREWERGDAMCLQNKCIVVLVIFSCAPHGHDWILLPLQQELSTNGLFWYLSHVNK